ncbi:MAG TPA: DinB family protein [Anaerolineales bacterium]|nr:DinB family protein [Anaerolineales bacterium]
MSHPLVSQLRFTRREFLRAVKGVSDVDARKRFLPMNCLSWNIGHLAWQEQRYFLYFAQGQMLLPEVNKNFAYGAPASTPALKDVLEAWKVITAAADPWLDSLTSAKLEQAVVSKGKPTARIYGNLLQRVIYHYWYHIGENMAIRQQLGHKQLPQFVGAIDRQAPYRPEQFEDDN